MQGNQSLSRELRASALCPGLDLLSVGQRPFSVLHHMDISLRLSHGSMQQFQGQKSKTGGILLCTLLEVYHQGIGPEFDKWVDLSPPWWLYSER